MRTLVHRYWLWSHSFKIDNTEKRGRWGQWKDSQAQEFIRVTRYTFSRLSAQYYLVLDRSVCWQSGLILVSITHFPRVWHVTRCLIWGKKKQEKLSMIINCLVSSDFVVSVFSWLFFFKVVWMGFSREVIAPFIPLICLMHSSVVPTAVMLQQVPAVARCFYPSSAAAIAIPRITKVWPAGFVGLSFTLGNKQTLVLFHFLLNW